MVYRAPNSSCNYTPTISNMGYMGDHENLDLEIMEVPLVSSPTQPVAKKRVRISQSDVPVFNLQKSLEVSQVIWDQFGGRPVEPHQVAIALGLSPTSGHWRNLAGSALAYGLTNGGYNAQSVGLAPLGKSIVAPTEEGQSVKAMLESVLIPRMVRAFFERYDKAKLPAKDIGCNVLHTLGVPKDRTPDVFELIIANGRLAGIITDTKTGPFVAIGTAANPRNVTSLGDDLELTPRVQTEPDEEDLSSFARSIASRADTDVPSTDLRNMSTNNRVFISHGKNKRVLEQLKEIIQYGKYTPVVSIENETPSKPVPDKVLDDMRSCAAGVINVHGEGLWLDEEGNPHPRINENVLIEIGAAMALYGHNYVLLVQKGVTLPSNLQGLYRCEYEGDSLDFTAAMKLLKIFNEFGKH